MREPARPVARRLDGWKAIAAYFARDRSTVMRWAQDRGLPIHRMPGGKQGSVFALEDELAQWSLHFREDGPPTSEAAGPPPPARRGGLQWIVAGLALIAIIAAAFAWRVGHADRPAPSPRPPVQTPRDPAAAAAYVAARDHWARRTPTDIARAITLYQSVIAREPGFAPAYAGLADAWLIFREYGEIGDLAAYNAAQTAALRALRLDPELAAAHRAMGFIHYWRENDAPRAIADFKRAIALNDRDSQTYFWYANVLADIGEHDLARQAYDRARLLSPGSQVIAVEAACAEWQAGRDAIALHRLTALARSYPDDATVHNCLTWVYMSSGDIANFARAYGQMARSRGEPALLARARALDAAVKRDPATAHRILVDGMRHEIAIGERRSRETPAFYASAMGDRTELLSLMKAARDNGEMWNSSGITARIARRWQGDAEVERLLAVLRAPRMPRAAD